MNFRKPISVAAAAAVGISMVAVSVSAANIEITSSDPNVAVGGGIYLRVSVEEKNEGTEGVGLFKQAGLDQTSIYGFRIKITPNENLFTNGSGGGMGLNSQSTGWKSLNWGNEGQTYNLSEDYVLTYTSTSPCFKASDTYCQVWIQQWWGDPINVESIELLDKDGNVIDYVTAIADKKAADEAAAAAAEEAATTEAPAEETPAETTTTVETTAEPEPEAEEEIDADVDAEEEDLDEAFADEEELVEEDVEFDDDDSAPADESFGGFGETAEDGSVQVGGEGTSNNWGQAVVLRTYNNIEEDEEPGDDEFDESLINPDNYIVVYYESDVAPELILQSWSGGEGWAKVPCDEALSEPGKAVFTYEYMTAMYQSEDLSTLDAVNIGDQGAELKVTGVYVVPKAAASSDDSADADFTVAADTTNETTAPASTASNSVASPATGNIALGSILSVMAVAGAAAVAAKKRK